MAPTEHRGPRSKCPSVGKLHASGREKATQPCRPALCRLDEDDDEDDENDDLGRPLGFLVISLMALKRDPIY